MKTQNINLTTVALLTIATLCSAAPDGDDYNTNRNITGLTGLDLLCNLPDSTEEAVESNLDLQLWGLEE